MNCRLVCKTWKRFLPIKDHERFLSWVDITDKVFPYNAPEKYCQFRIKDKVKQGWEATYNRYGKISCMKRYVNNLEHGISLNYSSEHTFCIFVHENGRLISQYEVKFDLCKFSQFTYKDNASIADSCLQMHWKNGNLIRYVVDYPEKQNYIYVDDFYEWTPGQSFLHGVGKGLVKIGQESFPLESIVPNRSHWDNVPSSYSQPIGKYIQLLPKVKIVEYFPNGTRIISRFRPNGRVKSTTNTFLGKRHGYHWVYDVNGELMHCGRYSMDRLEWSKQYHKKR